MDYKYDYYYPDPKDSVYHWIFKPYEKENKQMQKLVKDEIEQVIYNPPATVIKWRNGDKTVVKNTENDKYNPIYGVLMAYFQKHSGMTKTQAGKFFDKVIKDYEEQQTKKNKVKKQTELCIGDEYNNICIHGEKICCFSCNEHNNGCAGSCSLSDCKKYKNQ